jgi:hypothetical protein
MSTRKYSDLSLHLIKQKQVHNTEHGATLPEYNLMRCYTITMPRAMMMTFIR